MAGRYFVRIRGSTLGPLHADQVCQLLKKGKIGALGKISQDATTWRPLQEFPEFASFLPSPPPLAATAKPSPPSLEVNPNSRSPTWAPTPDCGELMPNWVPRDQTPLETNPPAPANPQASSAPEGSAGDGKQQSDASAWIVVLLIVFILLILVASSSDTGCRSDSNERIRYIPVPIYRRPVKMPAPRRIRSLLPVAHSGGPAFRQPPVTLYGPTCDRAVF